MQERGGTKKTADGGGRAEGQHGEGLRGLQEDTRVGDNVKISGAVNDGGGDDWPAVAGKLVKARKSWGRLARILSGEGADKRVLGNFFKEVVQAVLLFGAETWVLNQRIERELDSFMQGAARRITGNQPRRGGGGKWTYPPPKEAM